MADWTNLLTGLLGAGASIYSANQQSNAIQNAANTAAQQSQFRPVGITTRFGSSGFQYDPSTGQLVGAGYQVAPDVAAMREALLGLSGGQLSQAQQAQAMAPQIGQAAQGLFGLGMGYLGQSPQAAAQQWMSQQQQLLAPGREQELARLTNAEYNRGTLGLGVGATREGYMAPQQQVLQPMPQVASAGPAMLSAPVQAGFKGPASLPQTNTGMAQATPTARRWDPNLGQASLLPDPSYQPGFKGPAQMPPIMDDSGMGPDTVGTIPLVTGPQAPMISDVFRPVPETFNTMPVDANLFSYTRPDRAPAGVRAPKPDYSTMPVPTGGVMGRPATQVDQQMQGLAASNPRFAALYNARALQDAQLASQAQQEGMEQARFGQGLLSNALNLQGAGYNLQTQALAPYTNYFTAARAAETAGMQPVDISLALGSPASAAARTAAAIQQQGALDAAALAAGRNQAAIGGLSDPVAALIGQLTGAARPNASTVGYMGADRGLYF